MVMRLRVEQSSLKMEYMYKVVPCALPKRNIYTNSKRKEKNCVYVGLKLFYLVPAPVCTSSRCFLHLILKELMGISSAIIF